MAQVAKAAGFKQKDIQEYLIGNFGDARNVVYTLRLTEDQWVAFVTIDGGSAEETWSGPYEIVDASTVRAGAPPCGPITYDYALKGDELSLDLKDDDCPGPDGEVPLGELIAQTTIYENHSVHARELSLPTAAPPRSCTPISWCRSRKARSSSFLRRSQPVTSSLHLLALHERQAGTTLSSV